MCCIAAIAHAGLPETPRPRQLTVADGLPSNRINGITEDRLGYLWIATSDGLVRYDGIDFRIWRVEQGLRDNFVWTVHVDSNNRVWIGTQQAGLAMLDADRRQFHYYDRDNTPVMASNDVWSVASTADGTVWFGTADSGLYRLTRNGKITRYVPRVGNPRSLPNASVGQLAVARDGTLWIGTKGGAARWTGRDFERIPAAALNSPAVNGLTVEADGTLWIGTPEGVSVRRPDGSYSKTPWADRGIADKILHVLQRDRSGQYWFDIETGLGRDAESEVKPVPLYSAVANGLVRPSWIGAYEDREGGLWFVSYNNGLWHLPANWRRFSVLSRRVDAPESIANAHVRGIASSTSGDMWLVGTGGVLDRLDPETGHVAHIHKNVGDGYVLANVFEDRSGKVWVSYSDGLARVDPTSDQLTRWTRSEQADASLPGDAQFAQSGDRMLWMATERGGVQARDEAGHVVVSIAPGNGGLPADLSIEQIQLAPDGGLWIAGSHGLLMWNAGRRRFEPVPGAPDQHVYGFAPGERERVWLARFGAVEAYRWDGATLRFEESIDTRRGFPALAPSGLAVDAAGKIWLTSVRGLIRVDPDDRSVRVYGVHDGLPGQEFEDFPVLRPGDGRILAGGTEGLVLFDPAVVSGANPTPPLIIESIDVRRGDANVAFAPDDAISIHHGDRDLRIVARLLSFTDARNHAYRFRLAGYDPDWVEVDASGQRIFSQLRPGKYRLEVQARAADNIWSQVKTVAFEVTPPWWRTWWAIAGFIGLASLLFWSLANAYRDRLKRRHAWQLAEQQRELAEQASQAKTRFLATLGHEVRTPMTGVLGMSELLLGTQLNPQQRGYVGAIRGAGEHLLRLVNDALDLARIESGKLELADEAFDLHALMEELAALIGPLARQRGLAFEMTIGEDAPRQLRGDAARVRQILLNLLGNAVKFTERGRISLAVSKLSPEGVCFEVADTGPGLNAEQKARLFRRFEQAEGARTSARYGGSGLGLAISQELAAAMSGQIEVDSTPGEGTRFSVRLPLLVASQPMAQENSVAETPRDTRRSLSLLLVEDDPTVADVLTGLLRLQGHHVVLATHGLTALAEVAVHPFDAALLDLDLPGMDGLALARQLRIQGFDKPLIAITARADTEAELQSQQAGFDHFIRKPVTMAMLAALLDRAVPAFPQAEAEPAQPVPL
ncbi:MAG TPA: two-component regulator propeller domain-containing protein [Lysobacter sp.]|jgi:signal transduction histidine kinase/CheY-like chemotaxis protein/streptogramin lyase|nr:two-component regulator propeller domain-containing protein [Lysobacter sp.]